MPETLTTLRDRIELILQDTTNAKWDADTIDEGITQALDAYSERLPRRAIATVTLTAAGREVDISSITYRDILRVWWDYDSTDPAYPPNWREFEVWPGDLLFIRDTQEPAVDDVVRIWYTTFHTLNGLDSETETTFPDRHASLLAQGAAAFTVIMRRVELTETVNLNQWAPRNLREWSENQLQDFYSRLDEIAAREAAVMAGMIPIASLDRWDANNSW